METPALMLSSQLDSKRNSAPEEGEDKTFLTGARVEENVGKSTDFDALNIDNLANSQALVEQNLMKDPAYAKKYGVASTRSNSRKNMHKRT